MGLQIIGGATLLRNLSLLPYNYFLKIRDSRESQISLDLSRYGIEKSFKLLLPRDDMGLSRQLRAFCFREPLNCRCFVRFINKDDSLLDIGANIGFFTMLGSDARKIVCVEPLDKAVEFLEQNLKLNGLSDKVEVVRAAVGPKGKLNLEVHSHFNLSRIVTHAHRSTVEVDSIPLGELAERYPSNAIRVDVEGFEFDILYNQIPESITKISMEFHTRLLGVEKSRKLLACFAKEGFGVRYFVEDVPPRLYPLVYILGSADIPGSMFYICQNLEIEDIADRIFSGRGLKYLYLQRD